MSFDRRREDIGNVLALEHVNVRVPDQGLATVFYVVGLGLTRDPYLMVGTDNMWVNVGQQQFHLPTGGPQVLPGHVELVVPDLDGLAARLAAVADRLRGTRFAYKPHGDHMHATCPWGNHLICHRPAAELGETSLGMARVEFPVAVGHAAGIARFYETALRAPARLDEPGVARVIVGPWQELVFREKAGELPAWDGHHIAIYIADFSSPWRWLDERKLISEESSEHQYRFDRIVDPDTGADLFRLEHEVRSARHPGYLRPLVNRNPDQRQATYIRGRDAFVPPAA